MTIDLIEHKECREYRSWASLLQNPAGWAVIDLSRFAGFQHYLDAGMNSTAGNRYRYSVKNGYQSRAITWAERNTRLTEIHEINTSLDVRQGREMAAHYKEFPKEITGLKTCENHYSEFITCHDPDAKAVAYITANFCGEMAASSQILGHADHLKNGAMLNVWAEFIRLCFERKIKAVVYSKWSDGVDGLRYWKHSVGMKPTKLISE